MSLSFTRLVAPAAVVVAFSQFAAAQPAELEEIVVTADFREARIEDLPISVSVLDRAELKAAAQQHFEEAVRRIPNLNLSGEGSRARYFQLRGVGELEQYDGAPIAATSARVPSPPVVASKSADNSSGGACERM